MILLCLRIRRILLSTVCSIFIFMALTAPAFAEIISYTSIVKQPFNNRQSDDACAAAIIKAKREVLEKAQPYLANLKTVKDHHLSESQITALSTAVLEAEIVSQRNIVEGSTYEIEIEAKVIIDTSTLEKRISNFLKDRSTFEKVQRLEQREKELLLKVKELEERNAPLPETKAEFGSVEKKRKLNGEFAEVGRKLSAVEANRKALAVWNGTKFTHPEKAIAYLDEAISKDNHFAEAYNSRGIAYANLEHWQQSIKDYDMAIVIDPQFSDALNNRGVAYASLGNMQKALQDFDLAITLNPSNAGFYFNRGTAYANLDQTEPARRDLNQAIELAPGDISMRIKRGIILFKSELYQDAIRDFDYILYSRPYEASAYKYRGLCYFMLGEQENFCSDLEAACKYGDCESLRKMRSIHRCNQSLPATGSKNIDSAAAKTGVLASIKSEKRTPAGTNKSYVDGHRSISHNSKILPKNLPDSKNKPVTIESIENALTADVDSRLIAKKIREKGIDFEFNEEVRTRLNKVNAGDIVISAIIESNKNRIHR